MTGEFGYHARLLGTVAQLVEQGPFKALVLGSSPSRPTLNQSLALIVVLSVRKSYGKISAIVRRPLEVFALVPFDPSLSFIADLGGFSIPR